MPRIRERTGCLACLRGRVALSYIEHLSLNTKDRIYRVEVQVLVNVFAICDKSDSFDFAFCGHGWPTALYKNARNKGKTFQLH